MTESPKHHLKKALKEPLLHFIAISLILLVAEAVLSPNKSYDQISENKKIEITENFYKKYGRKISEKELDSLFNDWLNDELIYQTGLELGFDKHDSYIRRRVIAKTEKFVREIAVETNPARADLEQWFFENQHDYIRPPRLSFYYRSFGESNEQSDNDAATFLSNVDTTKEASDPSIFKYRDKSLKALKLELGEQLTQEIANLPMQTWKILQVDNEIFALKLLSKSVGEPEKFEHVEARVKADFIKHRQNEYLANMLNKLKKAD